MEEETQPLKWEGKTSAQLPTARAHEVWPFLEDFCNLHKCFRIDTCYHVDGIPGQPGLIRYCASTVPSSSGGQEGSVITMWAKEKLLLIDPIKRCLSYEVIDNNIGFKSYVATMRVLPIHDDEGEPGCKIEWSFLCDPIQGQGFEEFSSYIESSLQFMVKKIEDALLPATRNMALDEIRTYRGWRKDVQIDNGDVVWYSKEFAPNLEILYLGN